MMVRHLSKKSYHHHYTGNVLLLLGDAVMAFGNVAWNSKEFDSGHSRVIEDSSLGMKFPSFLSQVSTLLSF